MQLGRARLSQADPLQIQLSRVDGKRQLSSKKRGAGTRVITFPQPAASGVSLNVSLDWSNQHHKLQAFLDSGAAGNFMDFTLARHLRIQPISLQEPLTITALDGRPLGSGQVRQCTTPHHLQIGCHKERIQFFLIHSPEFPLILGFPWLSLHNPHIDWTARVVIGWGTNCGILGLSLCYFSELLATSPDSQPTTSKLLPIPFKPSAQSTDVLTIPKLKPVSSGVPVLPPELSRVPSEYADLCEVFSKTRAASLPPHRPYDCVIDLLPGTCPSRWRLYSLSGPERAAMEEYINDALNSGFIRPSTSPAGAGFFFVGKKDGGLPPCIDYRGLNRITVKNRYPLPLMAMAFELLQGATIFTKLDLRNAYHLVRIREGDEWKTAFYTPKGHYEYQVMPFGLVNAPAVFQALIMCYEIC